MPQEERTWTLRGSALGIQTGTGTDVNESTNLSGFDAYRAGQLSKR